ncbi:glycosyltransferase family 4 protein [Luteimonas changyuni]|uniref:glycosyltransferase family 4 protein n=1 Tax=Luteimonas sp. MJ145 TaxID=3129234 RepID=UPI0031BAAF57
MKVLYVANGIRGSGGLERVLLHKASYLCDTYGYAVGILVLNEPPGAPFYPVSPAVEVRHFHASGSAVAYLLAYRKGLRKAVAQFRPDVVSVCDDGLKGLLAPLLLPRTRPALVYERHASLELMRSPWQKAVMRPLARLYDRLVLLTQGNVKEWGVPGAVVIPNPLPDFETGTSPARKPQILCVGSLSHNKGQDLLIEAWARIAARHPDWSVQVYGKGDPGPLIALAAARGVAERIEFHQPVADIASRYKQASLFLLPSRSEGFGMVLLEAMSCGMPCISFDCPSGPGDILTDGKDGVLVPAEDVAALAAAMDALIDNPAQREALGQQARITAQTYRIDKIAASWDQLLTSLVARNV